MDFRSHRERMLESLPRQTLSESSPVLIAAAEHSGQDWLAGRIAAHPDAPHTWHVWIRGHHDADVIRSDGPCRVVHLLRDGRAVVVAGALRIASESGQSLAADAMAVRSLAAAWARSVHAIRRAIDSVPDGHTVMLESLRGASAQWDSLLTRLGLDTQRSVHADPADDAATPGQLADWRTWFTNDGKSAFKAAAGALLIELGYERDMNW